MRGSAQVPSIWNSCVAARISGWRRNICARKVPRPMAGLITVATSEAVPALISGTTTTLMSCVSRAMSALPSISTAAFTPFICRLLVAAMPCWMVTSPRRKSKAKPSLNTSRKSSVSRRGSDCRLSTPSSLARPGSALRNWPGLDVDVEAAVHRGVVQRQRRAEPRHLPLHAAVAAPHHVLHAEARQQLARVGDVELEIHDRAPPLGGRSGAGLAPPARPACAFSAAQLPVALKLASGMLRLSLFRRHSRTPPSRATVPAPRFDGVDLQPPELLAAQIEVVHHDVERRQRCRAARPAATPRRWPPRRRSRGAPAARTAGPRRRRPTAGTRHSR